MRKKKVITPALLDLFGTEDFMNHITPGRKYWYYFPEGTKESLYLGNYGWTRLTITYVRSGVFFYTLDDKPEEEFYCPIDSYQGNMLILDDLRPSVELAHWTNIEKYRFDDSHTTIIGFDNEDIDVPDDYYDLFEL